MSVIGQDVQVFDTAAIDPSDRFDAWREAVDAAYVPLQVEARCTGGYQGLLRSQDLGAVMATEVGGSPVTVWRDRASIALSDPGVYKFGLQLRGYCVLCQDGREAALTPGDLAIYDTTRPYTLHVPDLYQMFILVIPRDRLGLLPGQVRELTAERISGRRGLGSLTSSLLTQLGAQMCAGGADPTPRAVDAIVDLVGATLSQRFSDTGRVPGASTVVAAATAWIDEHLCDPCLTVDDVALSQHVSIRYLQKLFAEQDVTPSGWIRQRRIQRCRADLLDPALRTRPVASIGARWGFEDPSGFTRVFKAQTGMTPGEYRARGTP
ncbi:helix-turn-helix domain-containing protein [Microbacterium kribbense]|uniref:Helix-turn-helix domain-containing protein n=1 Tax=Microbacterium kribbense TaxID=433645 RepID=A0ABP7G8Y2_9MICO